MVIANMALQLKTIFFIMPKLLQWLQNGYKPITSQHAEAPITGLNLLWAQTPLLPCNCL